MFLPSLCKVLNLDVVAIGVAFDAKEIFVAVSASVCVCVVIPCIAGGLGGQIAADDGRFGENGVAARDGVGAIGTDAQCQERLVNWPLVADP